MLWLPVQGTTAAILSVCLVEKMDMNHDSSITTSENHHDEDCKKQMNSETQEDHNPLSNQICGDTSCNLSSNLLLPAYGALLLDNNPLTTAIFDFTFTSFIPEQPQRPPITPFF